MTTQYTILEEKHQKKIIDHSLALNNLIDKEIARLNVLFVDITKNTINDIKLHHKSNKKLSAHYLVVQLKLALIYVHTWNRTLMKKAITSSTTLQKKCTK